MTEILNNLTWQAEIRKKNKTLRFFEFPDEDMNDIKITGNRKSVTIEVGLNGLQNNMQTDAAAVEAWALALLVHGEAERIRISFKELPAAEPKTFRHFQRFLYRLHRFQELFPEIELDPSLRGGGNALQHGAARWLNVPGPRPTEAISEQAQWMSAASASSNVSEYTLEKALEVSRAFKDQFRLDKVMRQWPVGLFDGKVSNHLHIFTGKKSAIDLVGIREDQLFLFELKKSGNRKAGAISELMFYASVMRDSLGPEPLFRFVSEEPRKNCAIAPSDVRKCRRIVAILLAPDFHPLVAEPQIVARMNDVAAKIWRDRPVRFEAVQFTKPIPGGDFSFSSIHATD